MSDSDLARPDPSDPGRERDAVTLLSEPIAAAAVTRLRHAVAATARRAGLTDDTLEDFVLAVHELVTNVVRHGGGNGHLRLTGDGVSVTCEITDNGPGIGDVLVALPSPATPGHRGLWLAQQLTDGLTIDSGSQGLTAVVTAHLAPKGDDR
ncbi:ATP-binding protein [Micromonospora acroterricola]|uniref:ATP-binding protein n=1 Tax=Micromonospora acroterricola TaxID=2202421 RepID=A0A317D900_9ACTN|nr:ATP-binding protein [Micromonospora acroterricola]PWR09273.1 ATP-binding protein [Micromonospora acroterricola]